MMRTIITFIGLFGMWLGLTWTFDRQQVITGLVLSAFLTLFLSRLHREMSLKILNPVRWFWLIVYVVYFLYYCIRANLDVAYRALHPAMPIRPGIVKVQTGLQTDLAKTFLANSITLTPGTLTIDIENADIYVHWINVVTDNPREQTEVIVKRFERLLRRVFE